MKVDWRQFSPREQEALLRHVVLRQKTNAAVTPAKICEALSVTHFLSCSPARGGRSVFQFLPGSAGRAGAAVAEDLAEGIYIAALRTSGVDLIDTREGLPLR